MPRRFAPRNDMQKLAGCLRVQERAAMANLQLFRICPKYCFSFCPTARRTDCHVASRLAMTMGEVLAPVDTPCLLHTLRAPRPCTRAHVPAFCMSLRTSAHTGVAIRVPAEMPGKLALLRANPQPLSYSPKVLLSAMPCRKECGLPRRFAPRNDMQKLAACQHNTWALPVYCRKASLQSQTRCRLQHVIANQCAHLWQSASPQKCLASWHHFGQIRSPFRIRPKYYSPLCPAARRTDCHVASLLAMTCRNLPGVCVCKNVLPWQIRSPFRIRPKYYSPLCPAARRTDCPVASLLAMTEGGVLANRCKMGTGAHLCGPEKAMQRSDLSPGFSGGKAGAKDTQLVSPRCGNPHPRRET